MISFVSKIRSCRLFAVATVLSFSLASSDASAQQAGWTPARVWVVGSKEHAFVVATNAAKPGDKTGELRFWWAGPKSASTNQLPGASRFLEPFLGDIVELSADSDGLKLLAPDLSIYGYSATTLESLVGNWKLQATQPPLAWAGDDSEPIIYAVARTSSLIAIKTASTEPAEDNKTNLTEDSTESWLVPTKGSTDAPSTKHALILLRRGVWQRHPISADADQADEFWLAGRNEHAFLFWRAKDQSIQFAEFEGGNWSAAQKVTDQQDIHRVWTGSTADGPMLIVGSGPDVRSLRLNLIARDSGGEWNDMGAVREGTDYLTIDGVMSGVGMALGSFAVARPGEKGQVEFAWGEVTKSPALQFTPLTTRLEAPPQQQSWQDMVIPAIVLAVMTVMLLSRRDHVLRPAAVPPGLMIAPVWKRVLATVIDMLPASIAGGAALMMLQPELGTIDNPWILLEQMKTDTALQEKIMPVFLFQTLLYGVWCMVWELTTGTTLGKRIFGCRVLGIDGMPAGGRQIVLRNVVRIVMVSLGSPGLLITFLTMIVLTRNNQRMGDVLARTIVVQAGPPGPIPIARPRDSREDETPPKA